MHLSAQVGDKKEIPLKTLLVGESDYATGLPVTVANVHQMKGRTFKAVLALSGKGRTENAIEWQPHEAVKRKKTVRKNERI